VEDNRVTFFVTLGNVTFERGQNYSYFVHYRMSHLSHHSFLATDIQLQSFDYVQLQIIFSFQWECPFFSGKKVLKV
jgi:hypothetical protein